MSIFLEQNISQFYRLKTYKSKISADVELVELTLQNVVRVEAMIRTDSNYCKSGNTNAAPEPLRNKKTYKGSTAYWINLLKKSLNGQMVIKVDNDVLGQRNIYRNEIIYQVIEAIDRENSTHLNVGNGRKVMYERLCLLISSGIFPKLLKCKCSWIKKIIIDYFARPISVNGKIRNFDRTNYSFATKLCHYACMYMFEGLPEQDNYSIYDRILGESLVVYAKEYEMLNSKGGFYTLDDFKDYSVYINLIDKIRKKAEEETGYLISRNGFDHLLWYYHKGHPIK